MCFTTRGEGDEENIRSFPLANGVSRNDADASGWDAWPTKRRVEAARQLKKITCFALKVGTLRGCWSKKSGQMQGRWEDDIRERQSVKRNVPNPKHCGLSPPEVYHAYVPFRARAPIESEKSYFIARLMYITCTGWNYANAEIEPTNLLIKDAQKSLSLKSWSSVSLYSQRGCGFLSCYQLLWENNFAITYACRKIT